MPASAESRDRDKTQPEAGGGRGGTRGISVSRVKSADAERGERATDREVWKCKQVTSESWKDYILSRSLLISGQVLNCVRQQRLALWDEEIKSKWIRERTQLHWNKIYKIFVDLRNYTEQEPDLNQPRLCGWSAKLQNYSVALQINVKDWYKIFDFCTLCAPCWVEEFARLKLTLTSGRI